MTTVATNVGTFKGKTAEQWRAEAKGQTRAEQESFDRSDTDGALSQWAHSKLSGMYEKYALLAESDSQWEFEALFDLEGNFLTMEKVPSQFYGGSDRWLIRRTNTRPTTYVGTSEAKNGDRRRANDEKKGYRVGAVRCAATVKGYGSSLTDVGYSIVPDEDSEAYEIVDPGTGADSYQTWEF